MLASESRTDWTSCEVKCSHDIYNFDVLMCLDWTKKEKTRTERANGRTTKFPT